MAERCLARQNRVNRLVWRTVFQAGRHRSERARAWNGAQTVEPATGPAQVDASNAQAHELNSTSDGVVTHQGRQDHVMYQQEVDNLHAELTLRFGASKVNRWSLDWPQMKQIWNLVRKWSGNFSVSTMQWWKHKNGTANIREKIEMGDRSNCRWWYGGWQSTGAWYSLVMLDTSSVKNGGGVVWMVTAVMRTVSWWLWSRQWLMAIVCVVVRVNSGGRWNGFEAWLILYGFHLAKKVGSSGIYLYMNLGVSFVDGIFIHYVFRSVNSIDLAMLCGEMALW